MSKLPLVSIIIPMRNEELRIDACLESILANGYPEERLEIIVVDGRSGDRSRNVVESRMRRHPNIQLLDNPRRITSAAMNVGIRASRGDMLSIVNAHARLGPDFIMRSVQTLRDHPEADAAGGRLVSISESGSMGNSIILAQNSLLRDSRTRAS